MSNPLFNGPQGVGMGNGVPTIQQLKQEVTRRFNLPQGVSDPAAMIDHLVKTGQVSQSQVNAAYQQAQRMGMGRFSH